jgi:hypothetical protein
MEGRFPHAVRLIRTNCNDPAQEAGFNEWYDRIHVPDVLASGMVARVIRYRNADPRDAGPGYLAIHELAWEDLEAVAREVARTRRRLTESRGFHPAVEIVRVESWQRIGLEFRTPRTGQAAVAGIFVVESRCTEQQREAGFHGWYDEVHIPDLLDTGLFVSAYRFAAVAAGTIVGAKVPAEADLSQRRADTELGTYLAIYETATDPLAAVEEFAQAHRPRLKAAGRMSDIIEVTWRGIYRRLRSYPGW